MFDLTLALIPALLFHVEHGKIDDRGNSTASENQERFARHFRHVVSLARQWQRSGPLRRPVAFD